MGLNLIMWSLVHHAKEARLSPGHNEELLVSSEQRSGMIIPACWKTTSAAAGRLDSEGRPGGE